MKELSSIEEILRFIEEKKAAKYKIPEFFPFAEARELFLHPDVDTDVTFLWESADTTSIHKFLVQTKGFSTNRVDNGLQRLAKIQTRPS
jgi:flap endonuclease-1